MARKLSLEYPGAIYPVMNRGGHREPMFQDDYVHLDPVRAKLLPRGDGGHAGPGE